MPETAYVFDESARDAELERLRALEGVFDESTRRALVAAGLREGSRCLEIGAGAGSIATWMGDAVGPTGHVAAVDLNTRFLAQVKGPNIDVHEADIRAVGLEPGSFDVAHARFVFIHVPAWQAALEATLRLLKPGGRLVLEEPDFSASRALSGPPALRQAFRNVHRAIEAMFAARGMDFAFGTRLPTIFQERGLEKMTLENDAPLAPGGSLLARMMGMSTDQLRPRYVATGLATEEDIEGYGAFSVDPSCWAIYHGTIRAVATKPASERAG